MRFPRSVEGLNESEWGVDDGVLEYSITGRTDGRVVRTVHAAPRLPPRQPLRPLARDPPPATPDLHRRTSEYPPRETAFTYYWCCCNYHIKTAETETESKRIYWHFVPKLQIRCDTGRPPPLGAGRACSSQSPGSHSQCSLACPYSSVNLSEIKQIICETFVITIRPINRILYNNETTTSTQCMYKNYLTEVHCKHNYTRSPAFWYRCYKESQPDSYKYHK